MRWVSGSWGVGRSGVASGAGGGHIMGFTGAEVGNINFGKNSGI